MAQRKEMFAEVEQHYLQWEHDALRLTPNHDDQHLSKSAIRCIWIDWAGELPEDWRERLPSLVEAAVAALTEGVAVERGRVPWVDDQLLLRTICVIQRRSLFPITTRKAAKMLCRVASLAQQGVGE